jgi:PAS domain S-box-containing protein
MAGRPNGIMPDSGHATEAAGASGGTVPPPPSPPPPGRAGRRLAVLLLAVKVLLAAGFGALTWHDYDASLEDGWNTAERAALGAADHAERSIGAARLVTDRVAERLKREGAEVFRGDGYMELAALLRNAPQVTSLWVLDERGRLVANSQEPAPPSADFSDRPYFAPLRAGAEGQLSPLLFGRVSAVWFFSYNHAVRDAGGNFLGVVQAAMHAEEFQRFQRGLGLGRGGMVGLHRASDGAALMLLPLPASAGANGEVPPGISALPPQVPRAGAPMGRFEIEQPDGTRLLAAWQATSEGDRVLATAALPRAVALAGFYDRLWRNAALFGLAALLVGGLGAGVAAAMHRANRARHAAERGRRELAAVLEATGEAVLALDPDWRITFVNRRAAATIAGGRAIHGLSLQEAFPAFAGTAIEAACRRTMQIREPAAAEQMLLPLGRRLRVESHSREDGGIVVFCRDVTDEREAETRIAESEARLRQLFQAIDEGYALCEMVFDAEGRPQDYRFLEVNPLFARMTGVEDPVGRTARGISPELDLRLVDTYARVALQGETLRFEQHSSSLGRWFDIFATPVAPRGRFALVFRDVTARRAAEAALRESEARLRRSQEAGAVGVWELDLATDQVFWSDALRALLGYGPSEPPDLKRFYERVHPADAERVRVATRRASATPGARYEAEFRIIRADTGEERWLVGRGEVERDHAGRALRMVGVLLDVTDRRRAEAALAESETRLRLAQEAAHVGVFERDVPGARAHWSPAMFRLYGLDPEGRDPWVPDADFLALLHPEDRDMHYARRARMRADPTQSGFDFEYRIRRADTGETRWIISRGEVVRDAEGHAAVVRGVNHDITERRRAEERQMLLAREVDHRAKNALAVVQSIVGLTRHADPEQFRTAVIGRIAAMARAHTLLARDGWDGAELRELVEAELAPHGPGTQGGAGAVVMAGPDVALAAGAAQPLAMALHELATNAAKYGALSAAGGTVEVTWRRTEGGGLELDWIERGGPRLGGAPARRGFGSSVVRNTVERQLGGETFFDWPPSGLSFTLRLPPRHLRWPEAPGG